MTTTNANKPRASGEAGSGSSSLSSKSRRERWQAGTGLREGDPDADYTKDGTGERGPLLDRASYEASLMSPSERQSSTFTRDDPWEDHEETKSTAYLVLLTTSMLGLQIAWSVEMASVSPFLLSLGLSKSLLALVWIAGPLSGTLVQPYVGILSDNCRSPYGRRRPFMIGGTVATMVSLLALSWTREIVSGFIGIFGIAVSPTGTHPSFQVFAVALIYILDFAINVIQAAVRAFIVDCTPSHQQEVANAWASRVSGVGHIAAYIVGFVYLPAIFPWLGNTQFKVFVALGCFVMAATMTVSCVSIRERDPRVLGEPPNDSTGVIAFFKALYHSVRKLPPQVRKVCIVQLCAWIGWFPFLFYTTTYIGGLYVEPYFEQNPHMSEEEIDEVWERGTRVGTLALLVFAIMTLASSVFLPMIIPPTYQPLDQNKGRPTPLARTPGTPGSAQPDYFGSPHHDQSTSSGTASLKHSISRSTVSTRLRRCCDPTYLQISSLTLRRAWLLSHIFFFVLTWLSLFVRTPTAGVVLIGFIGIPWALTNWAPYALIAAEISRRDAAKRGLRTSAGVQPDSRTAPVTSGPSAALAHPPMASRSSTDLESFMAPPPTMPPNHQTPGVPENEDATDQAGVLLGIHNVAIAAPQVIATLVSSAMFSVLQKPRGTPGDDSVGWVLRLGGVCALAAAWTARSVEEHAQR